MAKGDNLQKRLVDFSVRIIKLTSIMPKSLAGTHIAAQILRSGTSPAPNYAEARAAESDNDFIHKLKIALKELHETEIWLSVIIDGDLLTETRVSEALAECRELCRIVNASIKTVSVRSRKSSSNNCQ